MIIEDGTNPGTLRPQELEAVYSISKAVAGAVDTEAVLNQIIRLVRPVFIFDSMVLYEQREGPVLEPTYARAIGRGRFREADLAWGEKTAQDAYQTAHHVIRVEELSGSREDRINTRHYIGLPLRFSDRIKGSLVFIRFGGPVYTPDQINLAEFICVHIAQLLEHRQLVEQIASLEAKRRLDSLQEDFISTISHELLTPLGFIKGYATTLLREDTDWDEQTRREFLTIIDEESDRLRELIDNLLDSSRLQAGTLHLACQPIRVDTLLKDITLRIRSLHESLKVELKINSYGLMIQADPTRLAQVFDNITNNAIKYAPGSPIQITLDQKDQKACIAIHDYGPGIPHEHLDKLFQRFYRVPGSSNSVHGTGLGLYICRKIIQAHGGEIEAESEVGAGITFIIRLPCEKAG
jgi:K+-sensing histidine kinase KdpD